jgi:transcriptional regulator with XRE-family HTH domain
MSYGAPEVAERTRQQEVGGRPPMEPLGAQIRAQREERDFTVRGLARASGVSASMISQIELEKARPSMPTLYAIVAVLGMSLDELFVPLGHVAEAPDGGSPVVGRGAAADCSTDWEAPSEGPVLRARNRLKFRLSTGVLLERLTSSHDPKVEFLYVTYLPRAQSCPADALTRHRGLECGVLLSGRLGVTIGDDSYELGPGDSIAFEATKPHRLWAIGDEVATAIWIVRGRKDDPRIP